MSCNCDFRQYREGNRFIQEFTDRFGNLAINKSWGVAKVIWEFDGKNLSKRYHFDEFNRLRCNRYTGSAIIEWDYDNNGEFTQESHYDENYDLIINKTNSAAVIRWTLKEDLYEQRFFDCEYNLTRDKVTNVAIIRHEMEGNNTKIKYFDESMKLCSNKITDAAAIDSEVLCSEGIVYRKDVYKNIENETMFIRRAKFESREREDDLLLEESFYNNEERLIERNVADDKNGNISAAVIRYEYKDFYEIPTKSFFNSKLKRISTTP